MSYKNNDLKPKEDYLKNYFSENNPAKGFLKNQERF